MSKEVDKLFSKLLTIIVVVIFVIAMRDLILTDDNVATAFGAIIGMLPFAETITNVVTTILGFKETIPIVTTGTVMTDLIKLAMMACLQSLVVGMLMAIFLPLPNTDDYHVLENYMESFGYKIKEILITVLSAPVLAIFASLVSEAVYNFLLDNLGAIAAVVLGILCVAVLSILSIIPHLKFGIPVVTAIVWRVVITLGMKMFTTFITNACCIGVYVAFLKGVPRDIGSAVIALFIWLLIMDWGTGLMQKAIVSKIR